VQKCTHIAVVVADELGRKLAEKKEATILEGHQKAFE
jgi:hypothetical protein